MGRTRDVLFVRLKDEYKYKEYKELFELVPEEYKAMFSKFWNEFHNLEDMLDKDNILRMLVFLYPPKEKHTDEYPTLYSTFREPSFQKMICDTFFDPVIIIKNVKDHYFYLECTIYCVLGDGKLDLSFESNDEEKYYKMYDIPISDVISKEEYNTKESEEYLEIKSRRDIVNLEDSEPFVDLP